MHLQKLELYGFKSFAEKIAIEFDKGITGVVGPNGSGKSNIGDAMRWVLGEQSARSLRGSKMEDVIFNGSQTRKALAWCEVTLHFDNSDEVLGSEYVDLAITRRFYRSGESEYFINHQLCRRKDIISLFRDTGIGKEGYSIIGQGRIDDILSSKANDRRNIFHEAAGIMTHRSRRDESTRRLEHTRSNIQRLCDIMEEMERQLKPLRRQCDNARRYITLSEELKILEVNSFVHMYNTINEKLTSLEKIKTELEEIEAQSINNVENHTFAIEKAQKNFDENLSYIEQLQTSASNLLRNLDSKHSEIKLIKERINFSEQNRSRLGGEIENASIQSKRLSQESDDLELSLNSKLDGSNTRQDEIEKYKVQIDVLQGNYNEKLSVLDQKKSLIIDNMNKLSDVKSTTVRYEAMTENLKSRKEIILNDLENLNSDDDIYVTSRSELTSNIASLDNEMSNLKTQNENEMILRNDMKSKFDKSQTSSREQDTKLKSIQTRLQMLKAMQNDLEGYDRAVKFLFNNDKALDYIEGILAELIDVPKKYTKAIDIALGRSVQNIVTYDEYDAKELIQMLKTERAGRATFLPLTTIKGRYPTKDEQNLFNENGCLGIGANLVKYDDRYKDIVYSLLGRTIICENIDIAIKLSRKVSNSCRFVTLDGDMINAGGSISGGSKRNNASSILSRRSEIEDLEIRLVKVKEIDSNLKEQVSVLEAKLSKQRIMLEELSTKINELNISTVRELEKMDKLNTLSSKNDNSITTYNSELEEIELSLVNLTQSIEDISNNCGEIESTQKQIRDEIISEQMSINEQGEELDELQSVLNNMLVLEAADEKELESVRREIRRLRADSKTIIKNAQIKESETTNSQEIIDIQKTLILEHQEAIISLDAKLSECNELLKYANLEKVKLSTILEDKRNSLESSREQLLVVTEKKYKTETRLEHEKMELEVMQTRMWDMYELTYANALANNIVEYEHESSREKIDVLKRKIKNMGVVNVNALHDYTELNERYNVHKIQYDDLIKAENDLLEVIEDLNVHMRKIFSVEFEKLNTYFSEAFSKLFGGGIAQLVINNDDDILESGIDIVAQPPGKKLQHLSLLSGGEKALTATAILFAMLKHRPSPFCLLDEIEAALDEANLKHFAEYLSSYSDNTQFVIITHRRATMEACDTLYGVTMQEKGISKMISVKISEYNG